MGSHSNLLRIGQRLSQRVILPVPIRNFWTKPEQVPLDPIQQRRQRRKDDQSRRAFKGEIVDGIQLVGILLFLAAPAIL